MDFEDLEKKLAAGAKMVMLCSPYNPVSYVWTKEELERLGELCLKYNAIVVSDEIHCDIVYEGNKHILLASISKELEQNTITCMAPSKTFNIAGFSSSIAIIPNNDLKTKFDEVIDSLGIELGNVFGVTAMEAAYKYGEKWLSELLIYLKGNIDFVEGYLKERLPMIKMIKPMRMNIGCPRAILKEGLNRIEKALK